MHSAALRFEGLVFRIRCGTRADLTWLIEFLTPQFAPAKAARAHWTITMRTATRTCAARAKQFRTARTIQLVSYALDTRTLTVPAFRSGPHRLTALDEVYRVVYDIDTARRTIAILRPAHNWKNSRIALMRVVRELAMNEASARGGLLVHGGAFLLGGKAVIISGPKGAGKTTSLLQALGQPGVRYVSNDRMLVTERRGAMRCRGIPTIISIRSGSLKSAPSLAASLPRSGYVCYLTIREATRRRREPARPDRERRYSISPAQLCALMETPATPGARLSAMLFPVIKPRKGGARLRPLGQRAASRRVATGLFRAGLPEARNPAFTAADGPRGPNAARAARLIARHIRCFELTLGRDAMTDTSWIGHLATLLESGPGRRRHTRRF
jgi:hypothetical protein